MGTGCCCCKCCDCDCHEKRTEIAIVLDSSGSMRPIKNEVIEGFNEQLGAIKEDADKGGDTRATLVLFGNSNVDIVKERMAPDSIDELSSDTYKPVGNTPMYDGVMRAINLLEDSDDGGEDTAFLVVVVSDGRENASKEYSSDDVASKVSELEDTGRWTFVYIGANHDLADIQKHVGISDTRNWSSTRDGTTTMFMRNAVHTSNYLGARDAGQTHGGYDSGDNKKGAQE